MLRERRWLVLEPDIRGVLELQAAHPSAFDPWIDTVAEADAVADRRLGLHSPACLAIVGLNLPAPDYGADPLEGTQLDAV